MSTMHLTQSAYNNFRTHNNLHTTASKQPQQKQAQQRRVA